MWQRLERRLPWLKILEDNTRYSLDDAEKYHKLSETYLLVSKGTEYAYVLYATKA
jgi:hypothetical protein